MSISVDLIKIAYRQSKDGMTITFAIHPNDKHEELANAPIGSQYKGTFSPLDQDGNAITDGDAEVPSPTGGEVATPAGDGLPARPKLRKPVAPEKRLTQQAGICCADPVFWKWISGGTYNVTDHESAARYVREMCCVQSRAEIIPGTPSGDRWESLYSKFVVWRDVPELAAS